MRGRCICGCAKQRGLQRHHVIYQQELRRLATDEFGRRDRAREARLVADPRNLVPVAPRCHAAHHSRATPLRVCWLPNSVFEFAEEVMGAGPAHAYLSRFYAGGDRRLDELLERADAELAASEGAPTVARVNDGADGRQERKG